MNEHHRTCRPELVDSALASALHASCATIHRTLGMMPGGIMFNRNMFLNIPLLMNFHLLQICRQAVIDDPTFAAPITNVVIMTISRVMSVLF
jgi:predicted ABC-type sugar transport system permease subunit